jgi:hypothetical protein
MLNQMNKHLNHLSMAKLMSLEQQEHGLKKKPNAQQISAMEMKEHKLGSMPSLRKAMEAEAVEHAGRKGDLVVYGSEKQRTAANKIYRGS